MPKKRLLTDEADAFIATEYRKGVSSNQLAKAFGVSRKTIASSLSLTDTPIRSGKRGMTNKRRYSLNEAAFDDAERNPAAAFFVGLLFADGTIVSDRHCRRAALILTQSGQDRPGVYAFREFLGSTHPIREYRPQTNFPNAAPMARLAIHSARLVAALARYGVGPRKSLTARVSLLENSPDFWAGVVCGDGCLAIDKRGRARLSLVGSEVSLQQFRDYCLTIAELDAGVRPTASRAFSFALTGLPALEIIRALFVGRTVGLPRKLAMAQRVLAECDEQGRLPASRRLPMREPRSIGKTLVLAQP